MSRTRKGKPSPMSEWISGRDGSAYATPGPGTKKRTHKRERRQAQKEIEDDQ